MEITFDPPHVDLDFMSPMSEARADQLVGFLSEQGAPVEENQPIAYAASLRALRSLVPAGGRVAYGEGVWSAEPTPTAVAPLAGRVDEFVTVGELVEIAVQEGFMPISVAEAGQDEWDVFESGYTACYARWLAGHPSDHPDAPEVRRRAAVQRAAYFGGYRGILGLAYLCLVAV